MPTYEYECRDCGHRFEEFQSIKADPLTTCPECKTDSLRRLPGAGAGLIFKGSGFYITDYKNNGNGQSGKQKEETKKETTVENKSNSTKDTSSSSKEKSTPKDTAGS